MPSRENKEPVNVRTIQSKEPYLGRPATQSRNKIGQRNSHLEPIVMAIVGGMHRTREKIEDRTDRCDR
jgi:hypothetical protein